MPAKAEAIMLSTMQTKKIAIVVEGDPRLTKIASKPVNTASTSAMDPTRNIWVLASILGWGAVLGFSCEGIV